MYIGRDNDVLIRLFEGGTYEYGDTYPALGVTYDEVAGFLWKQDMITWLPVDISSEDWVDLGDGYYVLKLRAPNVDRLGPMAVKVTGSGIATAVKEGFIEPLPPLFAIDSNKCVVSGNIKDITGEYTAKNYRIDFSLVTIPQKIGNVSLVTTERITTMPDAFGNFSVILLCGITVMVEIEQAGIRNQIVVPNTQMANLIDLLPSF